MRRATLYGAGFLALAAAVNVILSRTTGLDVPRHFPVSILWLKWNFAGFSWAALFLLAVLVLAPRASRLTAGGVWAAGLVLLTLAALSSGGWHGAFVYPQIGIKGDVARPAPRMYCHAIEAIPDAGMFVRNFTTLQPDMPRRSYWCHVRTHPPFTTLLHWWLFNVGGASLVALAFLFLATSIPLMGYWIFRRSDVALLLAVIPALAIYARGVDVVVAALATLALLAVVQLERGRSLAWVVVLVMALLTANALTFGGTVLALAVVLVAVRSWQRWGGLAVSTLVCAAAAVYVLGLVFGYDHVLAFVQAAATENARGWIGRFPTLWMLTRIECVAEIALFMGLPLLAVWRLRDRIPWAAVVALGLAFLTGAYGTGETARTCLWVYPWLLAGHWIERWQIERVTVAVAVQTVIMSILAWY